MNQSLIFRNIINLSISEIISRLLNFISYIYLARVILAEGFGIISFVIAFSSYFLLIVNFSSDMIASRETARLKTNRNIFVNKIVALRILLSIVSYALLAGFVLVLNQSETIRTGLLIYGLTFFANAVNIGWYFRGIERTIPIMVSQVTASVVNLGCIITIVHHHEDLIFAIIIMASISFLNSLILLYLFRKEQKIRPTLDFGFIRNNLKESLPVAVAGIMISIYYNLDHVMLGYMADSAELGYYAAAYKIILIALVPAGIIYQAFLPQFSKTRDDAVHRYRLMDFYSNAMLITGAFFTIIIFLFANEIIGIVYGIQYESSVLLMKILSFNIFLVYSNMTYGNPLIAWDKQRIYSYSIVLGAVTNVLLNIILIPKYHAVGAAIATIGSELIVMAGIIPTHYYFTKSIHINNILKSIACLAITFFVIISIESYLVNTIRAMIGVVVFLIYVLEIKNQFSLKSDYS